jgi:hypothetical protein
MLTEQRRTALAEILSLTISEGEAAEQGSWEQVRSMDRRRLELLDDFFREPLQPGERDTLAEQLRSLVLHDQRLLETARSARGRIAKRMDKERQQRSAASAYKEAAAGGGRPTQV